MKKIITILILSFFINTYLSAQTPEEYDDVFEMIQLQDDFSAMMLLRDFQKLNPEFPLTYYEIAKRMAKDVYNIHPIKHNPELKITAHNVKVYYDLAKIKMDDKVIKKYKKSMPGIVIHSGEKYPTIPDYQKSIDDQYLVLHTYVAKGLAADLNFKNFVRNYESCIAQFTDLNNEFPNLKLLYLNADKQIMERLETLSTTFDSSLVYLKTYQEISGQLSSLLTSPEMELITISNYQIDGITGVNYLSNRLKLWNYKAWVNEFKEIIATEIKELRDKIELNDKRLDANIQYFTINSDFNDNMNYFKTTDELRNYLKKYDYNPLPTDMFDYKMNKLNFLVNTRRQINNPNNEELNVSFFQRVDYYRNLVEEKLQLDKQVTQIFNSITDERIKRYQNHFDFYYKGKEGLLKYFENEYRDNYVELNGNFSNFKSFVLQEVNAHRKNYQFISHLGLDLPTFIQNFDLKNIGKGEYHTSMIEKRGLTNFYALAGVHRTLDEKTYPYIMLTDSLKQVIWYSQDFMNDSLSQPVNAVPVAIVPIDSNKTIALIHELADITQNKTSKNYIVEFNAKGNIVDKKQIAQSNYPRYFNYDEINDNYLIICKGESDESNTSELEPMKIALYDEYATEVWQVEFELMGDLIGVVNTNNNFLVFSNFNKFKKSWTDNELIRLKSDTPAANNILSIYINNQGQIQHEHTYASNKPYYGVKAIKVNSNAINIVGFKGDKPQGDYRNFVYNNELIYILTKPNGELVFSNFN